MKPATIVGILLIVVAVIGFALGGISFTHEKKDVDLGPLQVSHKETNTLPISPFSAPSHCSAVLVWWWLARAAHSVCCDFVDPKESLNRCRTPFGLRPTMQAWTSLPRQFAALARLSPTK